MRDRPVLLRSVGENLPASAKDRQEHIDALLALEKEPRCASKEVFRFFYDNLTIVDAKTAALLQFNGVLLAVFSLVFWSVIESEKQFRPELLWIHFVLLGLLVLSGCCSLRSCYVSLRLLWLDWANTAQLKTLAEGSQTALLDFLHLRDRRTKRYRKALQWAIWAISTFFLFLLWVLAAVVLHTREAIEDAARRILET